MLRPEDLTDEDSFDGDVMPPDSQIQPPGPVFRAPADLQTERMNRLERQLAEQAETIKLLTGINDKLKSRIEAPARQNPTPTATPVSAALADMKTFADIFSQIAKDNRQTFEAGIKAERALQARARQEALESVAPLDDVREEIEDIRDQLAIAAESKGGVDPETIKAVLPAIQELFGKLGGR